MALAPAARARLQASLAVLGAALLWLRTHHPLALALAALTVALAALAWLAPARFAPVQRALDTFARAIAAAFTWLVLGLVYFGLFTPLRMLRALLRRDPLQLRSTPAAVTFLQPLPPRRPGSFQRPF